MDDVSLISCLPHAGASTRSRLAIRQLAFAADSSRAEPCSLAEQWEELINRRVRIVDAFCTGERCFLVLRAEKPTAPLTPYRDRDLLERCLLGESQKVLAIDGDVAASTIASRLAQTLRNMGVECRANHPPLILTVMAHVSLGRSSLAGRRSWFDVGSTEFEVVSAPRPDPASRGDLSGAERQVVSLVAEGLSNGEIANRRRASERTIANQLASAFRKLGVSGRRQMVAHLVRSFEQQSSRFAIG